LPGYFKAIARIAAKERAKLYIPVSAPTTAIYDSLTQDVLPKDCVCWTLPPYLTGRLDDKTAFTDLCNKVRRLRIFSLWFFGCRVVACRVVDIFFTVSFSLHEKKLTKKKQQKHIYTLSWERSVSKCMPADKAYPAGLNNHIWQQWQLFTALHSALLAAMWAKSDRCTVCQTELAPFLGRRSVLKAGWTVLW